MLWLTDGSFEGCLTAVYEVFYAKDRDAEIRSTQHHEPDLFSEPKVVYTNPEHAAKVAKSIEIKLDEACFKHVLYAFFTEAPGVETEILRFLRYAYSIGPQVVGHETHAAVKPILDLSRKTSREAHRMLGLLRFVELESGIFYAPMEPDNAILPLMASHFSKRLGDRPWVIHDVKRQMAAFFDTKVWRIAPLTDVENLKLHPKEAFYQEGWRQYFKSIAIISRKNPELQKQLMPKRYWKYLVEKQA